VLNDKKCKKIRNKNPLVKKKHLEKNSSNIGSHKEVEELLGRCYKNF